MRQNRILIYLYLLAIIIFLIHFSLVGKAIYGDGKYYYSYLPSFFIDHTLNFSQAFKHLNAPYFLTPKKYPANIYPIGPAIFWTIPFLLINSVPLLFHKADGYNAFYQIAIGIWDISLVFIGLYFLKRTLTKFFSEQSILSTTIVIFLATNLLFYGALDVINSHSISFFLSCLFLFIWLQKDHTIRQSVLLGILLGSLTLVRPQDALFAIFPLSTLMVFRKEYIKQFLLTIIMAALLFSPQLFLWNALWGAWLKNPYLSVATFHFTKPHILEVLFSPKSGLFLWTPVTAVGFIGLVLFTRNNKYVGIPSLLFFLLQLYTIASWSIWWQGRTFSGRMFISSLPFLAIGIGYVLSDKRYSNVAKMLSIFCCILNPFLIILFHFLQ